MTQREETKIPFGTTFGLEDVPPQVTLRGFKDRTAHVPDVDPTHLFDKNPLRVLAAFWADPARDALCLIGPMGAGKSTLVEQFAARLNWETATASVSKGMPWTELIGGFVPTADGFVWQDGPLTDAARHGKAFVLEEYNMLDPGELLLMFNAVLDKKRIVLNAINDTVAVHRNFRLFLTGNAGFGGDTTGIYAGTRTQNGAAGDRCRVMKMGYLEASQEIGLIRKHCPNLPAPLVTSMVELANKVRGLFVGESGMGGGDLRTTMSTRTLIRWAKHVLWFSSVKDRKTLAMDWRLKEPLDIALLNGANRDDATAIEQTARVIFGADWR